MAKPRVIVGSRNTVFCPVLYARKAAPGSDCRCVRLDGFHLHNKKSNDDSVNVEQVRSKYLSDQACLLLWRATMSKAFKKQQKVLQDAKRDLLKTTKQAAAKLAREKKRLDVELRRINARVRQHQAQLKSKADRLAKTSKSMAEKTRQTLEVQVAKYKKMGKAAREEASVARNELGIVRRDLADARQHLSHALHIDRAISKVEKAMAKKRAAKQK